MTIKKLNERIIDLRESKDLTQTELAKRLSIDKSAMNKIESGTRKVSADELSKLASIFDVTTDYLLGKNNTPKWANNNDTNDLKKFLEDNDGTFTYGGDDLTEDEKQKLKIAMTQIFWDRHKHD
ncbi:helix-turn-helix transcriptional regulator [Pediococcus pentosaceus]|jgi:transcriptional regulator with XRE-family HTH domain|uniref:helix-turn-helix domain-containing protein n=1 Tax=Pediococcus pentosaceus TaxID=1255 RepID=UPI00159FCF56|nr:helix-turn-helix transcriptional regulator [Pediococcus pentosaceus]MBF7125570.1 helix-turn-helix transcriptional regulator [Pediococcus pentosaceus]MBF7130931.1 helix-turn-helix transcriptional regulator [Pediococcus pentosaceus]MCQ9315349.1 helix-turn-helix domain-containing protein [Pediococcus pentosaceus]MCQ9337861.1 helix-turn-helix domain-containing protein [Pediococcus pentosaceus]MCT3021097.1 XRE family transcriptional regulator [Pediococcus pentosaceus]